MVARPQHTGFRTHPAIKGNVRSNRNRLYILFLCSLILGVLGWHSETHADLLHLTWNVSSQDQDSFEIECRSANRGMFSFIAIVPPHQTWHTDYSLADNTTYCYRVRGYNSGRRFAVF